MQWSTKSRKDLLTEASNDYSSRVKLSHTTLWKDGITHNSKNNSQEDKDRHSATNKDNKADHRWKKINRVIQSCIHSALYN